METDIKKLALSHAEAAIEVLAEIMTDRDAPAAARISAAKAILDRGLGKPTMERQEPESREEQVVRIERVIVDPDPERFRGYAEPANDQFPEQDQAVQCQQDQDHPARPAVGDYSDYTRNGGDGWG